jgi:S-DNA-T family DNA segregation ATPase FtsK/SpoIIIE
VKNEEDSRDSIIITDYIEDDKEYNLPPLSLLRKNSGKQRGFCEKELLDNAQTLENTLKSFGLEAKVIQVNCGPTITRFEIQPSPGIKVSRIMSLADDIALSLAASDVRIEAPIPGKAAVGIEVPNKKKSLVLMRDVLESTDFVKSPSKLSIALGMDIDGNPKVADLTEMPHLLIAGATGSGKSVCIKTIISSILFKAHPNEVKLMMIDPKVVELAIFDGIPHLLTPVVTDAKKAAAALSWMVGEMERRYQLFAEEGVRDIARYNELYNDKPMPKIVVIIDELADLMMVAPRDVEDCICRLAQMARAAGIHLVVATQRPSVDVITGLIKANIPSRISFAVSSQVDSRTILDISGAEKLLGKGDMLFYPVGAPKPVRIQGAYITEEEVEKLINYCKKQKEPAYEKNLSDFNEVGVDKSHEETDELFEEAVKVVLDSGQASISMLQRRLRIGYARAARLIDEMEQRGIVGGYEGTKPREILISKEHYEKYFQN